MPYKLNRPAADFDTPSGPLCLEHFQMAYVTNDIAQAAALFCERLGVREFTRLEGETPGGGFIKADFAWVGTIMYEVIEASGPGSEIFSDFLPPADEFVLKHHHLGYLVQSQQQWDALLASADTQNLRIASRSSNPLVDVCFLEVPGFGHYLEYLFATEAGMNFFDNVART